MNSILLVDDEPNILQVIRMRLEGEGHRVFQAVNAEEALETARAEDPDLAIVDFKINGKNGIDLMVDLHKINPEITIIILTAYGTIERAVDAMKKGAYSYLTKPFDNDELLQQIKNCLERRRLSLEIRNLRNIVSEKYGFDNIIGKNGQMEKVMTLVSQAAETDSNVYIQGESGTGKELIAKTLHVASSRRDGPFIAINCAAIPESLMESELFGYEKGAFTGAARSKKGFFAQADKGSLLLDEISEMPMNMQAKLLRVLQEKEFYPLGGNKSVKIDIRIIAATNKDLAAEVENGSFREDLFYRLHVIPIKIPPLRERRDSIPLLADHFLKEFSESMNRDVRGFSSEAVKKMVRYNWPGNVRELKNAVECAVAMTTQDIISDDLMLNSRKSPDHVLKPLKAAKQDFEKNYVVELIQLTKGNVSQASKLAGKYRADFYELLKKYDINPAEYRG